MKRLITRMTCVAAVLLALPAGVTAAEPKGKLAKPDFTKGDPIPDGAKHDWNLGATGARGWIYSEMLVTADARQIAITKVDQGSPADGILAPGDVILGVGGQPFSNDPRTELGKALTVAESEAGGGKLAITRWRAGKTDAVVVKLSVLGSYSVTAPYDCPKSKLILEQGCKALAARITAPSYDRENPITRSLNALALLASGNPDYLPLVKKEAQWASNYSADAMQTWYYGYVMILLSEYVMATGDESVLPGLKRLALAAAIGQSAVGSWGHRFAKPDGRLYGYGMMNSPGLPLTISLVMARTAGVKDPAVDRAIELSARLMRFYIGKGAVPYGDHDPWIENHDDNGKCGMAAVLFNLLGEKNGAEFFSRMSVASHGPERDTGHTGNFFNMLWAMPGVAQSGPHATGAWMNEFGAWYFDFARCWDGSFPHQGPPEKDYDSYEGWDATGGYLLAYAMPLKKLYLTGKRPAIVPQLDAAAAQSLLLDGRGWSNKDRNSYYDKLSSDEITARLASWSPIVRERAAMALARRKDVPIPSLIKLLDSPSLEARYGACQALAALRGRAAPAVEPLRKTLAAEDLWLRIKAAEALAGIGAPAMVAEPELLRLLAQVETKSDPRGMQQRYLSYALFRPRGGLLGRSLEGVDREALYQAVRAGLKNQDGAARGAISSVYQQLSAEEIKPLVPAILQAVEEAAPSGEMFAEDVRIEGLRVLAKHRIKEGLAACVKYTRYQNPWASEHRTTELMKILLTYGTHAKAVIPELTTIANYFDKDEKDFPRNLMTMKANCVRETIRAIEASTDTPELISIDVSVKPVSQWRSKPPADCPFKPSMSLAGIEFSGRHSDYRCGDTFYPSWASDGNLYSPWTDGKTDGVECESWKVPAKTGHAVMIGEDPLKLEIRNTSPPKVGAAAPYTGRYPAGSLVYNGIWYYGTYCLGPDDGTTPHNGFNWNWPNLGPMPGFQISKDFGKTWEPSPLTPEKPLFPEPRKFLGPVKMGAPHFVDFGKNMEHSPDGKAYLIGMGAEENDPKPRSCIKPGKPGESYQGVEGCTSDFAHANLSWITADQAYLARVTPSPETINDPKAYEFFAGHDAAGQPVWTSDFKKIKPLVEWNNHMGCVTATYVPGLKKYLMCVTDGWPTVAKMTSYILEADALTGPWRMVSYMPDFGEQGYFLNFPSKFISPDGQSLWLCYSANFSSGWNGVKLNFNPPGGRYGLCLHEVKLLMPTAPAPDGR